MAAIVDVSADILWPRFPYPGLRPFRITSDADESLIFRGRNTHRDDILERLDVSQFVSVVGPSGCGKSSLVKVGVVPALRAGLLTRVGYDWVAIETRPGHDPLGNLAATLAELNGPPDRPPELPREEIAATLAARRSGLWLVVERLADRLESGRSGRPKCVLLVLDQFEEIFARIADPLAVERYVTLITHFFREPHPQLFIVLTMRTDFIGECANFPGMAEIMNKTQYITPVLRGADLMDAIVGPAETYGGEVEPALAKAIAEDMGSGAMYNADHLPLMQHALLWLWRESWRATDLAEPPNPGVELPPGAPKLRLTLAQYRQSGGLHGVLNRHADKLLADLRDGPGGERRTAIARTMFRRLSERDASGRYKRAPARMETVRRIADCTKDELNDVIEPFAGSDASFVERRREVDAGNPLLDFSHESLIRQWDRLRSWADAEAEKVAFFRKIVGDAEAWSRAKRSRSFLRTGGHLSTLEEWWRENQPTQAWAERYRLSEGESARLSESYDLVAAYRDASVRNDKDERRRARAAWAAVVVAVCGVFALIVFLLFLQYRAARDAQETLVSALASQHLTYHQPDLALRLVLEEMKGGPARDFRPLARDALRALHETRAIKTDMGRVSLDVSSNGRWLVASSFRDARAYDLSDLSRDPPSSSSLPELAGPGVALDAARGLVSIKPWDKVRQLRRVDFSGQAPVVDGEHPVTLKEDDSTRPGAGAFSADGARVVSGGMGTPLQLWDATGEHLAESGQPLTPTTLAVNADGSLIAVPDASDGFAVYGVNGAKIEELPLRFELSEVRKRNELLSKSCRDKPGLGANVRALAFHPIERGRLAYAVGCVVVLEDVEHGKELMRLPSDATISRLVFSRDGARLALGGDEDGLVQVFDLSAGRPANGGGREAAPLKPVTLGRHAVGPVFDLRFFPNGNQVVSAGGDGTLRIWNVAAALQGEIGYGDVAKYAREHLPKGGGDLPKVDKCLLGENESCGDEPNR